MAKILADKDVRQLIGSVIIGADENLLNPNGIELRLGRHVLFHSTNEERQLDDTMFLKVNPGESVTISSMESIDFANATVQKHFPGCALMGLITPTTTMMREGISQASTKIDPGFRGILNWGLRNSSIKDLILQCGEPILKLTLFLLDQNESPQIPYGERARDGYQDSDGIRRSRRKIPADIPKNKMVASSFDKLDPKKQLKEAGYPFDHIGTELVALHGKFEVVSSDVRLMKEEFNQRTAELSSKIATETKTLSDKIEETRNNVLEKVEYLFDRKFLGIAGVIIGILPIMYGAITFLKGTAIGEGPIALIAILAGVAILFVTQIMSRKTR